MAGEGIGARSHRSKRFRPAVKKGVHQFGGGSLGKGLGARSDPCLKDFRRFARSETGVRRDKAALSSGCKPHPANAPAGSNRSSYGGDEIAEAFGKRVTNW